MIYTATLNPSLDYTLHTRGFSFGKTNRALREVMYPGGKGINVSVILRELGHESVALGFCAGFVGDELIRRLEGLGISQDFILLSQGVTRINVKLKDDAETEINGLGPTVGEEAVAALLEKISRLSRGDVLVLAGSVPPGAPQDIYEKILTLASERGAKCVVDTTGERLMSSLKYRPFLIKPNVHELADAVGQTLSRISEIADAAKSLHEAGAENVLVSCGGDGAVLVCREGVLSRPACTGDAVNTVGAGDSSVAGFIAAHLEGRSTEDALKLAVCAGSATAFNEWLASKQDIIRLYNI